MELNIKIYTNTDKIYLHVDTTTTLANIDENLKCFDGLKVAPSDI